MVNNAGDISLLRSITVDEIDRTKYLEIAIL